MFIVCAHVQVIVFYELSPLLRVLPSAQAKVRARAAALVGAQSTRRLKLLE